MNRVAKIVGMLALFITITAHAMTAGAVAEIRPGVTAGLAAFFDASNKGATGVDYTLQSTAQASGTVTSATTTVTATGTIFDNTMLGDCITDGTTFVIITGFTSSTIVTVDTAPSWTAASIKVGGAQSTIDLICTKCVAGNTLWEKATGTNDTTTTARSITAGTITAPIFIRGYNTTRGDIDNGTPTATHTTAGFLGNITYPTLALSGNFLTIQDWTYVSGMKLTSSRSGTMCNTNTGGSVYLFRCSLTNTSTSVSASSFTPNNTRQEMRDCDFSCAGASGGFVIICSNFSAVPTFNGCRITSANGSGLSSANPMITSSVFYSFASGQTAVAIGTSSASQILGCTFDSNAGTCISSANSAATTGFLVSVSDCIFSNCGTGANNLRSGTQKLLLSGGNNQFWSTTTPYTGWNNVTDTTGFLPGDVQTGSNSNYVAQGSQNFRPSSTSNSINQGLPLGSTIGAFQLSTVGGGNPGMF